MQLTTQQEKKGKKKTKNITTVKNASTAFNAFY